MRKNHPAQVALGLSVALITFTWVSRNAVFLTDPWLQPERRIGEPLSGFWRLAPHEGCYADAAVYQFEPNRFTVVKSPNRDVYSQIRLSTDDGRVRLDFPDDPARPGVDSFIVFQDRGDRLEWERLVEGSTEIDYATAEKPADLVNCGVHGFGARLALIWNRPFKPVSADLRTS